MSALKTMLEGIVSITPPVANIANSGDPINLVVESSGAYTGTAKKVYEIVISTAGESTIAKCTITDLTDGTDTVLTAQTITTGAWINLGVKGSKIKFTFTGSMIYGNKWTVTCNTYKNTVKKVYRVSMTGLKIESFPAIIIAPANQDYLGGEGGLYNNSFTIEIEAWIEERLNIDTELNEMLEDIEKCLAADPFLGGKAFDSMFSRVNVFTLTEESPYAAISIGLLVKYKQVIS
jgi:hypothetical protein